MGRVRRKNQQIYCPKCEWHPSAEDLWGCSCDHAFHTFDTGGVCPACHNTWYETQCPACWGWSAHADWYHEFMDVQEAIEAVVKSSAGTHLE